MYITSTGAANHWLYLTAAGYLFSVPDSTSSANTGFVIADQKADPYAGWVFFPALASGASTGPDLVTVEPGGASTVRYYNGIFYADLVSNGVNYAFLDGSSSGSAVPPGLSVFGVDTDVDLLLQPQGAGVVKLNYATIANGGGAAPTLGTIGGSGPQTVGQAGWMKFKASDGKFYFMPVWST